MLSFMFPLTSSLMTLLLLRFLLLFCCFRCF